ncbi:MAG: efflux transporter outer membrane subunit [Caulobacteraceae bacterium]|nr:efflux transporter outer membrane subunit [Caulobacteraceae bacterium]
MPHPLPIHRLALILASASALAACAVGPDYRRPEAPPSPAFKEAQGWTPAVPADGMDRGAWWSVFGDAKLDELERRIDISNQNLKSYEAAYRQARALTAQDRASLFPSVDLNGSGSKSKSVSAKTGESYSASLGASWAVDVWGKIRRTVESDKASAQASAADLANARLSAQSELAADYVQLRLADADKALYQRTVDAYARSLRITQNRYTVGVAAKGDVLTAKTQLESAQASLVDLDRQRTAAEHAIAVLVGVAPSELTIAPDPAWSPAPPPTPVVAPSVLLQRRPDIAAAERQMAAANAKIGVAVAGYFPDISLSASGGYGASALSSLFKSSSATWSFGGSLAQTVFDAGATSARVREARAGYDQTVATYRQTVLTAFQQVEDALAAARVYQDEAKVRAQASADADEAEQIALNQYRAGQVDYTTVVTAQATALSARQTLLSIQGARVTNAVSLIEAMGGGWDGVGGK